MDPPFWDSQKMLDVYIRDYLEKRNMRDTAQAFMAEANVSDLPVAVDVPGGFLMEWFSLFHETFMPELMMEQWSQRQWADVCPWMADQQQISSDQMQLAQMEPRLPSLVQMDDERNLYMLRQCRTNPYDELQHQVPPITGSWKSSQVPDIAAQAILNPLPNRQISSVHNQEQKQSVQLALRESKCNFPTGDYCPVETCQPSKEKRQRSRYLGSGLNKITSSGNLINGPLVQSSPTQHHLFQQQQKHRSLSQIHGPPLRSITSLPSGNSVDQVMTPFSIRSNGDGHCQAVSSATKTKVAETSIAGGNAKRKKLSHANEIGRSHSSLENQTTNIGVCQLPKTSQPITTVSADDDDGFCDILDSLLSGFSSSNNAGDSPSYTIEQCISSSHIAGGKGVYLSSKQGVQRPVHRLR